MTLFTKSIQITKSNKDGIRICIMRRPNKDVDYDIWMPTLAPSHELLTQYHQRKISWTEYEKLFTQQVLKKQKKYIKIINIMAQHFDVTLLCWEKTPRKCHRRLVAQEYKRLFLAMPVKIL